jgi:type IV secretion system protein VirD4
MEEGFYPGDSMQASRFQWDQIIAMAIVLATVWAATQWTAWQLGFAPQLGHVWFHLWRGMPVYPPPAFFWWWLRYDAYAPAVFSTGAAIAASGGVITS